MAVKVNEVSRSQTIYVRDILPEGLKNALKEPSYDLDKLVLHQIKIVSNGKKAVLEDRSHLLTAIYKKCNDSSNNSCGPYNESFLTVLLKDIEEDEADARRKVLGEQESVEMFKKAFAEDEVTEQHVANARAYRDAMTMRLADIVEGREIVFIALEILKRSPKALMPQNEPEMEALGKAYTNARERYLKECEILKKLTEWKKKPELHITEEDELFSFFNSDEAPKSLLDSPDKKENLQLVDTSDSSEEREDCNLSSALASYEEESSKLVHFKKTKVDSVDNEFNILADLATDTLKHEEAMCDGIKFIQQTPGCLFPPDCIGIKQYLAHLKAKYPKLKIKISTKGFNFSLKVMQKTKSIITLDLLTTLLNTNQEFPDEVKKAQEVISEISSAVKKICSKYGRCSMAFQSVIQKETQLQTIIKEAPKVNYAESLRISGNFTANMKEVKRAYVLIDKMKKMADNILKEVMDVSGEYAK